MNKKTIIPIILFLVLLLLVQFNITGWAIRSISSSQDNKDTLIRNSNGKYWTPSLTDSQIEIQEAIDDLDSGTVWLPPGEYEITDPIILKNNTRLVGTGIGNTVLRVKDGMNPGSQPSAGDVRYVILARGKNNVTISDMTIDANMQNNPGDGECIRFDEGTSEFIVERVQLLNARDTAFYMSHLDKGLVSNIYIKNVQEWHGFAMTNVNNSIFSDVIMKGIDDGQALDLHFVHNCGFNNFVTESYWGVKMVDYQSSNNNFNNFQIRLINNSEGHQGLKLNMIDSSNFNNIKISGSYKGIACSTNCYNNNFNNIIIEQPNAYGIHLDGGHDLNFKNIKILEPESYGITISGSSENVSFDSMLIKNASYGFRLDGPEDIKLSNTVIANSSIYGVYLNGVSDVQVTRSVIKNSGTRGIHVSDNGDSSDYLISDCIIDGTPNQGIYVADVESNNFIITNNILINTGSGIQNDSTGANQLITDNLT